MSKTNGTYLSGAWPGTRAQVVEEEGKEGWLRVDTMFITTQALCHLARPALGSNRSEAFRRRQHRDRIRTRACRSAAMEFFNVLTGPEPHRNPDNQGSSAMLIGKAEEEFPRYRTAVNSKGAQSAQHRSVTNSHLSTGTDQVQTSFG